MSRYIIHQFRYNGLEPNLTSEEIKNWIPLRSAKQIGIIGPYGLGFYLNENETNKITIGPSGVYSLELPAGAYFTSIKFESNSVNNLLNNSLGQLVIDYLEEAQNE